MSVLGEQTKSSFSARRDGTPARQLSSDDCRRWYPKRKIKKDIQDRNLEQKCVILGKLRQEELPALYKASDLFLLASDYEIYGMVILEAMYFGTPVISTLTAGAEVLITSGEDGMIIPNKKADTWSHVIAELCNDTTKLTAMSSRASKK